MKTKEEIDRGLQRVSASLHHLGLSPTYVEEARDYIKSLSTINPNKIDEERFKTIYNKTGAQGFEYSFTEDAVKQYNSTLEDHQVLQPLPSECSGEFVNLFNSRHSPRIIWQWVVNHYGTPTKKELVSVEELMDEITDLLYNKDYSFQALAKHFIDTYSLNPPKRGWWMDLKEGDKFMCNGKDWTFHKAITMNKIYFAENMCFDATVCQPYTEPSILDKFMASLSNEQKKMYEEMKEATK